MTSAPDPTTTSSRSTPPSTAAIRAARASRIDGQVFGVNTAIFSPSGGNVGIGFAIPVQPRQAGDRQPDEVRQGRARLARRAHPERDRRDRREPGPARDARVRWSPASRPAGRRPIGASRPATSSSSSTARRSTRCARCRGWWPRPRSARTPTVKLWRKGAGDERSPSSWASCPRTSRRPSWASAGSRRRPPTANATVDALGHHHRRVTPELKHAVQPGRRRQGRRRHRRDRRLAGGRGEPEAGRSHRRGRPGGGQLAARGHAPRSSRRKQEGKKSILLLIDRQGDLRFVALRFKEPELSRPTNSSRDSPAGTGGR